MDYKIKEFSYGLLMSHTFPGIFLFIEIAIGMKLFADINLISLALRFNSDTANIIILFVSIIYLGTFLGFIIDGIHHFLFSKYENKMDSNVYKYMMTSDQLQIYKQFVTDELWYPYEGYSNILITLFPLLFILPKYLKSININIFFIVFFELLIIGLIYVLYRQALDTLKECDETEKELEESFEKCFNLHTKENGINTKKF